MNTKTLLPAVLIVVLAACISPASPGVTGAPAAQPVVSTSAFPPTRPAPTELANTGNMIRSIRTVSSAAALGGQPGVEIEVVSDREFPVRNELVVLRIGAREFTLSRYPESGDTHTLIFTLTPEEFAQTATGDLVTVYYGHGGASSEQWNFDPLDKSLGVESLPPQGLYEAIPAMLGVNLITPCYDNVSMSFYPGEMNTKTAADLDYYHGKGLKLIRMLLVWESLQPALSGPLKAENVACIHDYLDLAAARRMKVILDIHNFARYIIDNDNGRISASYNAFTGDIIGSPNVPVAAFADLWTKLASEFKGHSAVYGYDLMNEPHDMGNISWLADAQAAIDGIRSVDMGTTIILEGDYWSNTQYWTELNDNLKPNDPAHNLIYSGHQYWDNGGGAYENDFTAAGAYPLVGVDDARPFVDWLKQNHFKGSFGEFGIPSQMNADPRWLPVMDNFLAYMNENCMSATWFWGGYILNDYWDMETDNLNIEPLNGVDHPPMAILQAHASYPACSGLGPSSN